jgi:hypothetical protein
MLVYLSTKRPLTLKERKKIEAFGFSEKRKQLNAGPETNSYLTKQ